LESSPSGESWALTEDHFRLKAETPNEDRLRMESPVSGLVTRIGARREVNDAGAAKRERRRGGGAARSTGTRREEGRSITRTRDEDEDDRGG